MVKEVKMPLNKQTININFSQGLDTKTDPYQVPIGKFLSLQNSIFLKGGLLQKRNGFGALPTLPNTESTFLTTFNSNLTAIGSSLNALIEGPMQWSNKATFESLGLSTLPLIRNNTSQSQVDSAISINGLVCTVYTDQNPTSLSTPIYKYAIADSTTGQNVISPTQLITANTTYGTPRVFVLGNFFIIVFTVEVISTYNLQYVAVSINNPSISTAPIVISTNYAPASTVAFDGHVLNENLYLSWNNSSSSAINMTYLQSNLSLSSTKIIDASHGCTMMSIYPDLTNDIIWASYYSISTSNGYATAVDININTILAPTQIITSETVLNITSVAAAGFLTFYYEISNNYTYDSSIPTHYINTNTLSQTGTLGTKSVLIRSVGLASKAFIYYTNGHIYVLAV
ncbi:MAG TPA: hypothetical protein VKR58_10755, partial [Aquella sp.]|nr:hypothetical protein [Aquella sp.]